MSLAQEPTIHSLVIPDELREMTLIKNRIFEDINQDGRTDLLFISKDHLLLSYQNTDGSFSPFEVVNIPLQGAVDFADIFPGGEKEICVMHKQGISCLKKENGRWGQSPRTLVERQTFYEGQLAVDLTREYFIVDLENDGIPELILWGPQACYFYRQDSFGFYQVDHTFFLETHIYLAAPGMKVYSSPLSWLIQKSRRYLYHRVWPLSVRYLNWAEESISRDFMIRDINHDGRKDLVLIQTEKIKSPSQGISKVYEYRVYFLGEEKKFSPEPGRVIRDPHGAWLSPTSCDIDGDGDIDLLEYQIGTEGNLIQRPRLRYELYLALENGEYPEKPSQIWETSDFPLGAEPLIDVNGDGLQDLVLIHVETRDFSFGGIIRKYVEESVSAELRVLLFRAKEGFSREGMIRRKVNISFVAGIPISVAGDFNGDGFMDMLLMNGDRAIIYPLLGDKTNFSGKPWLDVKIPPHAMYEVNDLDGDSRSEIILYYPDIIQFLQVNPPQK